MSSSVEPQRRENQRQRSKLKPLIPKAPAAQFVVYLVLIALYARTRVLKATGKKEYYREEKTE